VKNILNDAMREREEDDDTRSHGTINYRNQNNFLSPDVDDEDDDGLRTPAESGGEELRKAVNTVDLSKLLLDDEDDDEKESKGLMVGTDLKV